MKKIILSILILLFLTSSLSLASEHEEPVKQIQTLMEKAMEEYHIPGASLAVVHHSEIVFQNSWGTMSDGSEVTADTTFLIGSVSKPLTSVAIMVLEEDGKVKLDEPIETYIPWFSYETDSRTSITVRHLLEQTSGISAYDGMKVLDRKERDKENGITQAVTELSGVKLNRAPGEAYEYNSANYLLLGAIIESVSGQSFAAFMEEQIFSPLGMKDTTADYDGAVEKGFVPGYHSWFGRPVKGEGLYDHSGAPYGYMSSTANDLVKFITFMLNGGDLISEQSLAQLQTPPENGNRYGLGWHFPRTGEKFPYHTGATTEYRSEVFYIPELDLGAVLLMNKYHELEAGFYLSIMKSIRSIINGEHPELATLNVNTQWITLVVVLLIVIICMTSLIRLKRKTAINNKFWAFAGGLSLILAAGLIPLFTYSMSVSWRTVVLFLPDIAFLIQCLIAIWAVHGILVFYFMKKKQKETYKSKSRLN